MDDMIIKGTGNSRWLKSVANITTLYPTYESFAEALAAGTFPIDLNGINPAGVEQAGTKLNKSNLLTDATATGMGLTSSATPDQALSKLRQLIKGLSDNEVKLQIVSYVGTGNYGANNPCSITFSFAPAVVLFLGSLILSNNSFSPSLSFYVTNGWFCISVLSITPTDYNRSFGFGYDSGDSIVYGKKSADWKTITWYHSKYYTEQLNDPARRYYYLALA